MADTWADIEDGDTVVITHAVHGSGLRTTAVEVANGHFGLRLPGFELGGTWTLIEEGWRIDHIVKAQPADTQPVKTQAFKPRKTDAERHNINVRTSVKSAKTMPTLVRRLFDEVPGLVLERGTIEAALGAARGIGWKHAHQDMEAD